MGKVFAIASLLIGVFFFVSGKEHLGLTFFEAGVEGVVKETVSPSEPAQDPCEGAETHWKSAESLGTIEVLKDHLAHFGQCAFAGLARSRLSSLENAGVAREDLDAKRWQDEEARRQSEELQRQTEAAAQAAHDARMRQIRQQEEETQARIASQNRIEAARKQAAESKGWTYVGNGIAISPGKGY
jgi:hypothetical protein